MSFLGIEKKYWVIGGIIGALIAIIQRGCSSSDSESNTETNSAGQIQYETLVDNTPVKHTATPEDAIQEVLSRFHTDGTKKYITRIKVFNKEVPKDAYNYQVIIDFYAEFDGSIYRNGAIEEPKITDSRFRITKINGDWAAIENLNWISMPTINEAYRTKHMLYYVVGYEKDSQGRWHMTKGFPRHKK